MERGRHPVEDRLQPHQLIDQPDEGARGRRQAGGTVGSGEEGGAQAADRGGGVGGLLLRGRGARSGPNRGRTAAPGGVDFGPQPPSKQVTRPDQGRLQRIARGPGPQDGDRDQGRRPGQQPATEPGRDRADRPGERHRQDEPEEQRGRRAGQHRAHPASEQDREADDDHADHGQPDGPGREGAEADEGGAHHDQGHLGGQPVPEPAAERDEEQHRQGPERGERGHRRVADDLLAQRENGRHDDRGAPRAPQRGQARVAGAQPPQAGHRAAHHGAARVRRAVRWH